MIKTIKYFIHECKYFLFHTLKIKNFFSELRIVIILIWFHIHHHLFGKNITLWPFPSPWSSKRRNNDLCILYYIVSCTYYKCVFSSCISVKTFLSIVPTRLICWVYLYLINRCLGSDLYKICFLLFFFFGCCKISCISNRFNIKLIFRTYLNRVG